MNLLDLQDRVILITGGCGAIGRVIVRELTAHNARVAVNDILTEKEPLRGPQYLAQLGCEYFGMYKVFRT